MGILFCVITIGFVLATVFATWITVGATYSLTSRLDLLAGRLDKLEELENPAPVPVVPITPESLKVPPFGDYCHGRPPDWKCE